MGNSRILIDTSIIIEYFRKEKKNKSIFYQLTYEYYCQISTITVYELWVGKNEKNGSFLKEFIDNLTVLSFDYNCACVAAEIYRDLKMNNSLIGISDILLGATAISNNLSFATLNKKHFSRIPTLKLIDI